MNSQAVDFTTPAIRYGIDNEKVAIELYTQYQQANGHSELLVTESGFVINPSLSFLGASPDGAVYDPSNEDHPFGNKMSKFCERQNASGSCC